MSDVSATVERLTSPIAVADLDDLAGLLVEAVESGAAVSFVLPLARADARAWWQRTIDALSSRSMIFAARAEGRIVGTVQVLAAWAPNQPHRGDIAKLLVRRDFQRRGVGEQLMRAAEDAARASGFTLLTLDAKAGSPAERLYRRLGWTAIGAIPGYARDPDGPLHDAVVMFRSLRPPTLT